MLLTRIVTIYRQWSYLRRWIDAPGLFDSDEIAWVVCNDAPDDPCPPDLRAALAARRVTLLEPAFNLGRSEARNRGARAATTPWLEFIDGDDIPLSVDRDWLRAAPTGCLLHYPHRTYALVDDKVAPAVELEPPHPFFWDIGFIRRLPVLTCRPACLIFPAAAFHAAGGFDGRYDTCEDLHLLWKLDRTDIAVVEGPTPKQLYRVDSQQSCDAQVIGFYTHRLLRLGVRDTADPRHLAAISAAADRQALRAVNALLVEFEADGLVPSRRSGEVDRYLLDLFWRSRRLLGWLRPSLPARLREAIKILLGR